jgi:hypothetical protein
MDSIAIHPHPILSPNPAAHALRPVQAGDIAVATEREGKCGSKEPSVLHISKGTGQSGNTTLSNPGQESTNAA